MQTVVLKSAWGHGLKSMVETGSSGGGEGEDVAVAGRQITRMHHVRKVKDVYSNSKLILQLSGGRSRQSSLSLEIAWSSSAQ